MMIVVILRQIRFLNLLRVAGFAHRRWNWVSELLSEGVVYKAFVLGYTGTLLMKRVKENVYRVASLVCWTLQRNIAQVLTWRS